MSPQTTPISGDHRARFTVASLILWVLNLGRPPTGGGSVPTQTPVTSTPTPAPTVQCSPRPSFNVTTSRSALGVLAVTSAAQAKFTARRAASGAASTVRLVVIEACGDWSTFVGDSPTSC